MPPRRVTRALPPPTKNAPAKKTPKTADPAERVRSICLTLPETSEKIAWGAPTFRVKKKLFAMYDDHHSKGRIALWLAAPKGAQVVLVSSEPTRFFVPPYVGKSGWIGVVLDSTSDARLESLAREAWLVIAPPKLHAQVES